ncbi:MAG: ABC transporter permease [Leucobacter sp.]
MSRLRVLARESFRAVVAGKAATIAMVALALFMVTAIVLTQGKNAGVQQQVLSSMGDVATRTLTVQAPRSAGLSADVVRRIEGNSRVEWVAGFGAPVDVTNGSIAGGRKVALRDGTFGAVPGADGVSAGGLFGDDDGRLRLTSPASPHALGSPGVYVSRSAMQQLGLSEAQGYLVDGNGLEYAVIGSFEPPPALRSLEPLVIRPVGIEPSAPGDDVEAADMSPLLPQATVGAVVTSVIVVAHDSSSVAGLAEFVQSVLGNVDSSVVEIKTSQNLAELKSLVQGQLFSSGRVIVAGVLVLSSLLVCGMLSLLTMLKRKEYGRRRALGASRGFVIALVLAQTVMAASAGAVLGAAISAVTLLASRNPQPEPQFYLAAVFLAVAVSGIGAAVPALLAARRDPVIELRVP